MTDTVKLGKLEVGRLWLAPMAGYTDVAFRELCIRCGAALTVTEMVSVRGLVRDNAATDALLRMPEVRAPRCVQLFGNDPDEFYRAAQKTDCDIIDINMGCPMPKIVKNGDGAALMRDACRAADIVSATVAAGKPVTVKTRLGYAIGEELALPLIERVAAAGAAAVTVHGRYAEQRYAGASDVEKVKRIAQASPIPVIYNGDVAAHDIPALCSDFAAVAIGRAALSDPYIFGGARKNPFALAREYVTLVSQYFDERYTINQARKFFVHFFKGVAGGKAVRVAVNNAATVGEVYMAIDAAALDNAHGCGV